MAPKPDREHPAATFSALEQLQARQIAALEAENEELRGRLKMACEPCAECGHIDWRELDDILETT